MSRNYIAAVFYVDSLENRMRQQNLSLLNVHSITMVEIREGCLRYSSVLGHYSRSFSVMYLNTLRTTRIRR